MWRDERGGGGGCGLEEVGLEGVVIYAANGGVGGKEGGGVFGGGRWDGDWALLVSVRIDRLE